MALVSRERWEAIPQPERQGFAPLYPDFLVEIRSKSDDLAE
ncbi:hypothetical protein [Spirosoma sp.]|nr:hypothetical protein [Spirosoma sp.]MCX6218121.1 hypothetical protein [Spirosoma sp.]